MDYVPTKNVFSRAAWCPGIVHPSTRLHGVTSQNTLIFRVNSNLAVLSRCAGDQRYISSLWWVLWFMALIVLPGPTSTWGYVEGEHPTARPKGSFSACNRERAGLWTQQRSSNFPTCRYVALYYHHELCGVKCGASSLTLRVKLFPLSFPRASYFLPPFGLYCSACLGILLVSIFC